jgi:hypothetical protein
VAGIAEGVEVDIVEELPVRATMLQSRGNTSTNGFEAALVHTFRYLTKKNEPGKEKNRRVKQVTSSYPSFSLASCIYIYKYTQGSAKGNDDSLCT